MKENNVSLTNFSRYIQIIFFVMCILYLGKSLFIPLSFALLISFILYPICKWLINKGLGKTGSIFISLTLLTLLLFFLSYLLYLQLINFSNEWTTLGQKLIDLQKSIEISLLKNLGLSLERQKELFKNITKYSTNQIVPFFQNTFSALSSSFLNLILIPIFSALILFHSNLLTNTLYYLFPSEKRQMIHEILIETIHSYYNFIKGMLIVYLIVGILNSLGLWILGIPHPFLFGFIASILTFIPYVGIIISSLLPISVAWLTYNSIWHPVGVILIFGIVQVLEANVIFPKAVGNRLRINTLAIIIMILVGGIIWGTAGMILFIPFASILKLIADRTENLKALAVLLGNGKENEEKTIHYSS